MASISVSASVMEVVAVEDLGQVLQRLGDGTGLLAVDELGQGGEVDEASTELHRVEALGLGRFRLRRRPQRCGSGYARRGSGEHCVRGLGRGPGTVLGPHELAGAGGDIGGHIGVEGDDEIGDLEEGTRTTGDEDRGDPALGQQRAHPGDERRDRLALGGDERTHPIVADHEVRRRGVLIDEQRARPGLEGLDEVGRLRGRPAGIRRGEESRVGAGRQIGDER
jgi:hypothetical protein